MQINTVKKMKKKAAQMVQHTEDTKGKVRHMIGQSTIPGKIRNIIIQATSSKVSHKITPTS